MEETDYENRIQQLEKTVRKLKKKLERSEADREQMERASELRESVLKGVIRDLEESQNALETRGKQLEFALNNLKTLQGKLVESEKMSALGIMVAGVAHEINNPVSFIYGNLDHARSYIQDLLGLIETYKHHYPQPVPEILEEIKAIELDFIQEDADKLFASMMMGAERIQQIVRSLRTFSRLDEADCKLADIHEGIDSTLVILNSRIQPNPENPQGVEIIREYGKLPSVEGYHGQLNQVFLNILLNAIDVLEEGIGDRNSKPTIRICTQFIDPDWVEIRIADNGRGINQELIHKVFDPFFTTKPVGKGTGLGLSTSYQIIVELHGGKLECLSTPQIGTEFAIAIPIRNQKSLLNNLNRAC